MLRSQKLSMVYFFHEMDKIAYYFIQTVISSKHKILKNRILLSIDHFHLRVETLLIIQFGIVAKLLTKKRVLSPQNFLNGTTAGPAVGQRGL